MTLDRKKIKRKTEGGGETLSLLNVQISSLEAEELTSKNRASSMLNISEAASGAFIYRLKYRHQLIFKCFPSFPNQDKIFSQLA